MSNREQVEAEAEWRADGWAGFEAPLSNDGELHAYERGFIAGRTVSAEQVEAAAEALDRNFNPDQYPIMASMFRDYVVTAFRAAGLLIEGDDDE